MKRKCNYSYLTGDTIIYSQLTAEQIKLEANNCYKQKDYKQAQILYSKAIGNTSITFILTLSKGIIYLFSFNTCYRNRS